MKRMGRTLVVEIQSVEVVSRRKNVRIKELWVEIGQA